MTEVDWPRHTELRPMLAFLSGKASDRKLRLFAAACCRRIWHLLPDERSRRAVEVLELFADGLADQTELANAAQDAHDAAKARLDPCSSEDDNPHSAVAVANAVYSDCLHPYDEANREENEGDREAWETACVQNALEAGFAAAWATGGAADLTDDPEIWYAADKAEEAKQCALLRDIIGDPFRPTTHDPSLLIPAVISLAQTIYDERSFDRMPELADALERAGCHDTDVLAHCLGAGPHVRACWVLDLILGKK